MSTASVEQDLQAALAHHRAGQLPQAEALYRRILEEQPKHPDALHGLGYIAHQVGRHPLALDLIQRAMAANPAHPRYRNSLAGVHQALGTALQAQGQCAAAIEHYRIAIQLKPDYAEAYGNLGVALASEKRVGEAIDCFRQAVALRPDVPETLYNLGNALNEQGQFDEAINCFRTAVAVRPDYAPAYNNLANILQDQHRIEEAIECYRKAVALQPGVAEACYNLANAIGASFQQQGRIAEALASYQEAIAINGDDPSFHDTVLLVMHYAPDYEPQAVFQRHVRWGSELAAPLYGQARHHANDRTADRCLRIGYVSPDLRQHAVASFLEPILAAHDQAGFEVFCYSNHRQQDRVTQRFRGYSQGWRDIAGIADEAVADMIRQDRIDILVDLAGHTDRNRLLVFARKPAPVQVTYMGYPDTTGLATVDYRLTDAWADPPGQTEQWHTEQLVRLPTGFLCYRPPDDAPPVASPPSLKSGQITFGCFNTFNKLTPQVMELWCQILRKVPGSRMMVKTQGLGHAGARRHVQDVFDRNGIEPERVQLRMHSPTAIEHLSSYHQVDVALDSHPYNGATTTCEALWMGVPVVSLAGITHFSRVGLSLLNRIGLGNLATQAPEQYVRTAVELARDPHRLAELRSTMRRRMAPLLDGPGFTRHLEEAYRVMWRAWCGRVATDQQTQGAGQ